MVSRDKTRKQRYNEKKKAAKYLPVSFCTVNFMFEENVAYLTRAAACFGIENIYVIGSLPSHDVLRSHSGSTQDLVSFTKFKTPSEFLEFARKNNADIISAEISNRSVSLHDCNFNPSKETIIVLGHETLGVPVEILEKSSHVEIPMNGPGFCLNTSFAGTVIAYEIAKKYLFEQI